LEGPVFDRCISSSSSPDGTGDCKFAFSGKMEDKPYGMWTTDGEGLDAWIEVFFKGKY